MRGSIQKNNHQISRVENRNWLLDPFQVAVLTSQEEAYREVISSSDGIFLATGPEDACSEYRRSMLCHQIAEDERKRCLGLVSLSSLAFKMRDLVYFLVLNCI